MPLYGTFTESEWAHLEDGTYLMRCTGIEETEIENSLYDPRIYRLSLETVDVVDDEAKPIKMDAIASRKLSPNSKMTRWLKAFNVPFVKDERIDLEAIVGRVALATVVNKVTEQGERSRVTELVAAPRARNAPRDAETLVAASDAPEVYHPAAQPGETVRDVPYEPPPDDAEQTRLDAIPF